LPQAAGKGKTPSFRTCLGCREKKARQTLLRFALDNLGLVIVDSSGRYDGRHVYCCRKQSCFDSFLKNLKGISRGFRRPALGFDEGLQKLFGSEQ